MVDLSVSICLLHSDQFVMVGGCGDVIGENFDQDKGIEIVRRAIRAPCRTIAQNGNYDGNP